MTRDINPFGLRMSAELRALVEESARANGRSINAEVVLRLEQSFEPGRGLVEVKGGAGRPSRFYASMEEMTKGMLGLRAEMEEVKKAVKGKPGR